MLWVGLIVGLLAFGDCSYVRAEQIYGCYSNLYNNISLSQPQHSFSVFDKIYLKITCTDLSIGSYSVVSDWTNPHGKLIRQNTHQFEVKEAGDYMSYSWMKLLRKGPLQRNLTGQDVDLEQYGEWVVKAYLQGREVAIKRFTVY